MSEVSDLFVVVHGDGVTDDTKALRKILNGEAVGITPDGKPLASAEGLRIKITETLELTGSKPVIDRLFNN